MQDYCDARFFEMFTVHRSCSQEGCIHTIGSAWYFRTWFPEAQIRNSENENRFIRGHQFHIRNSAPCKPPIKTEILMGYPQQDAFAVEPHHHPSLPFRPRPAALCSGLDARRGSTEHSGATALAAAEVPATSSGKGSC